MVTPTRLRSNQLIVVALLVTGGASHGETAMSDALQKQALTGDLQAQRQLAETYRTGAKGTAPDPALACAWRIVVVASRHPDVTAQDTENRKRDCDGLDQAQQRAATAEAKALVQRLYGRDLVLPADFFGGPRYKPRL